MRFLSNKRSVVAQLIYVLEWKVFVSHLRFLKTNNLWRVFVNDSFKLMKTGSNAVYIKRDNFDDTPPHKYQTILHYN